MNDAARTFVEQLLVCSAQKVAGEKRLREEFAKLQVEVNEEKSRIVNLDHGESFGFLGFDFRRIRSIKRKLWMRHRSLRGCAPVLDPTCERPRGKYPWPTHRL